MRVHELAKQIDVSSKDICQFLSTEDKLYKTMSGLTKEEEDKVKKHFNKSVEKAKEKSVLVKEKKEEKTEEKTEHKISKLYFPQNSEKKKVFDKNRKNNQNQNKTEVKKPFNKNQNTENRNNQGSQNTQNNKERNNNRPFDKNKNNGFNKNSFGNKDNTKDFNKDQKKDGNTQKPKRNEKQENHASTMPIVKDTQRRNEKKKPSANKKYEHRKDEERTEQLNISNQKNKPKQKQKAVVVEEEIKHLVLPDYLTIKQLAEMMKKAPAALVKDLFLKGKVVTINQEISYEVAEEIALEYDCLCEREEKVDVIAELLKEEVENEEAMTSRPPVVAVMGHVDHGKTSLLDAIRQTHVTDKEFGGITQKIGAYQVRTNAGRKITFLDTPGHEAFTSMRMRGALATDIAILVVAADDGVMPQTVEAINHAKAAGVEIIVAVNKIDKQTANIDKVKQELTEYELISEEWGGSTIFCPVSAHTKEGIDDLLDMIMLTADVLELKANKKRKARGIVIEAELDKGRGVVATVLVQKGTLKVGDSVAAGTSFGKVRAMLNDVNKKVKEATPSMPVEILGLNEVPNAGEIIMAFENDKEARNFAATFVSEGKKKLVDESRHKMSLDDLFEQIKTGNLKELNIIVKADVQGSVEAIKQSLEKLSNDEVAVKIIHGGVGNINESDVILASASSAIIIGFNVKPDNRAKETAEREEVDMRLYTVIYDAIDDVQAALNGMLEPIYEERVIGHAEIRQIFKASGVGNIAGSLVMDGKITKTAMVKITRDGKEIYSGKIASLKRFKDEVKEVKGGYECGLVFEDFDKIEEGDIVEASEMFEIPRN